MTDYLEEQLDNAEALLEQLREMEWQTARAPHYGSQSEEVTDFGNPEEKHEAFEEENDTVFEKVETVYNLKKKVEQVEERVDMLNIAAEIREESPEKIVNQKYATEYALKRPQETVDNSGQEAIETVEKQSNAEKAEKNGAPLAAQLKELDHAVAALAAVVPQGRDTERRGDGYPVFLPGPQTLMSGEGSGLSGQTVSGFAYGGELRWAEQADRAFRRDSRRYDGGFYLY